MPQKRHRIRQMNEFGDTVDVQSDDDVADDGYWSEEAATFGDRVAAARRAAGLTQENLSRKLGIKLKTLRDWEDDISEPRANKLQMMAGVLNVSLVWLLTGEGDGVDAALDSHDPDRPLRLELRDEVRRIQADLNTMLARLTRLEARLSEIAD